MQSTQLRAGFQPHYRLRGVLLSAIEAAAQAPNMQGTSVSRILRGLEARSRRRRREC
jgi:hypothetical protein